MLTSFCGMLNDSEVPRTPATPTFEAEFWLNCKNNLEIALSEYGFITPIAIWTLEY